MAFNFLLAAEIARRGDRDTAPFFAGRDTEISALEAAVREVSTRHKRQANFRIFQGPPGCGKTSLAEHLAKKHADEVLFVSCKPVDMANERALLKKIRESALAQKSASRKLGDAVLATVGEYFEAGTLEAAVRDVVRRTGPAGRPVVLHLDEAHGCVSPDGNPGVGRTLPPPVFPGGNFLSD